MPVPSVDVWLARGDGVYEGLAFGLERLAHGRRERLEGLEHDA